MPVVAELPADLDARAIDLRVLQPLAEKILRPAVAVGVAVVEKRDALVERERAKPIAVLLRAVSPPVHAKDPAPEGDRGDFEIRVAKRTTFHRSDDRAGCPS